MASLTLICLLFLIVKTREFRGHGNKLRNWNNKLKTMRINVAYYMQFHLDVWSPNSLLIEWNITCEQKIYMSLSGSVRPTPDDDTQGKYPRAIPLEYPGETVHSRRQFPLEYPRDMVWSIYITWSTYDPHMIKIIFYTNNY